MASGGGADKTAAADNHMIALLAMFLAAAGAAYVFWLFKREYLVVPAFGWKWMQLQAYDFVVGIRGEGRDYVTFVESMLSGRYDVSRIGWEQFKEVVARVNGLFTVFFVVSILAMAGGVAWFSSRNRESIANLNLESFIGYQASFWNTSAIARHFHPEDGNPNMAPQLQPIEYMESRKIPQDYDGHSLSLDAREAAMAAFEKDLGPIWRGVDKAPTYVRAIVAMYVTHVAGLEDKGNKLKPKIGRQLRDALGPVMVMTADPKARDAKVEAMIGKYLSNAQIMAPFEKLAESHGYLSTVMIRTFEWAKKEGVFASAEMLWVKMHDRPLWYALNNVGRVAFHIEGAGAQSHYYYELASRKPLLEAKVDAAVIGLEEYLVELNSV